MIYAIGQLPRVGSPRSESMLIPFLQVEARLLALLAPSILCKKFWFDTDIHPGSSPPHIPISFRSAGIRECDSGPALRAKHLPVLRRAASRSSVFFSGGRFLSADPLAPPASKIWQSQPLLVHSAVSKTWQAQKSSGI